MKLYVDRERFIDTSEPLDISIPLSNTDKNLSAWYVPQPVFEPVRTDQFLGSVKEGGKVNFRNVSFNPHGHGTHTECLGHITDEVYSVNKTLTTYFYRAKLISIAPTVVKREGGKEDTIIDAKQLQLSNADVEALIIRTLPNLESKKSKNYSNTNPTFMDVNCVKPILEAGITHLLIDTPSVDKEEDEGALAFHHAFWQVPENPNFDRTITELIYVDSDIPDGEYILNFQVAPFENDASPSRPVLYKIKES